MVYDTTESELHALLKELEALPSQEEKQAFVSDYFSKKNKKEETPQVIGLPENASGKNAKPSL